MPRKRIKRIRVVCERCSGIFEVLPSRYRNSNVRFCSDECYRVQCKAVISQLDCEHCGEQFERPRSQAVRSATHFCSKKCYQEWLIGKPAPNRILPPDKQIVAEFTSGDKLVDIAQRYNTTFGVVSAALKRMGVDGNKLHPRPTGKDSARYLNLPVREICQLYQEGMSTIQLATKYGVSSRVIALRLEENGISRRDAGFGSWHDCSDGHRAQSYLEYLVDEWLFDHNLLHQIHSSLPWNRRRRGDFLVSGFSSDVYIEVWGVVGNKRYKVRREEKLANYERYGCQLIEIYPQDIDSNDILPLETLTWDVAF